VSVERKIEEVRETYIQRYRKQQRFEGWAFWFSCISFLLIYIFWFLLIGTSSGDSFGVIISAVLFTFPITGLVYISIVQSICWLIIATFFRDKRKSGLEVILFDKYDKIHLFKEAIKKWEEDQELKKQEAINEEILRQKEEEAIRQKQKAAEIRRLKEEKQKKSEYWVNLDGWKFEKEIAVLFRKNGYQANVTRGSGDGGVDIFLRRDNKDFVVQCKQHASPVSPAVVREIYGALLHHKADGAKIVCTNGFTSGAIKFAEGKPIELLAIDEILKMASVPTKMIPKTLP
jgi:HJR/Mrr/RecB family endonuclease